MSILIGRPDRGREHHIYSDDDDPQSVCGRAPRPNETTEFQASRVTCWKCKRAFTIISQYYQDLERTGRRTPAKLRKPQP